MTKKNIRLDETGPGFNQLVGITEIIFDDHGRTTIEIEIKEEHCNIYGIAHGGFLFTLCDTAVGVHAYQKGLNPVTIESHINFYRSGNRGDTITAIVQPRKIGKTFSSYLCEVKNSENELIVDMAATMFHTDK